MKTQNISDTRVQPLSGIQVIDHQLNLLNDSDSQELDLRIQDDPCSQSTQSSTDVIKICKYADGEFSSQEAFNGERVKTQASSQASSQPYNTNSSNQESNNFTNEVFMGADKYNSCTPNICSNHTIGSSQRTDYFHIADSANECILYSYETPKQSQEDEQPTQINRINSTKTPKELENDVDSDSTDIVAVSDDEQDRSISDNLNSTLVATNHNRTCDQPTTTTNNSIDQKIMTVNQNTKLALKIDQQRKNSVKMKDNHYCNSYGRNDENRFKSIGKSEETMNRLESVRGDYLKFAIEQNKAINTSIGKSDQNFQSNDSSAQPFFQPMSHCQQMNQNNSTNFNLTTFNRGKDSFMEQQSYYSQTSIPIYNRTQNTDDYSNENVIGLSIGKDPRYGSKQCDTAIYSSTRNSASKNSDYIMTDLDNQFAPQQIEPQPDVINYSISMNECYDERPNISRTSTPTGFAPPDEFDEDSNDSATRKRKKKPQDSRTKITKTSKEDVKKNAEIQSEDDDDQPEMQRLSQQMKDASIEPNLDDSSFEFFEQNSSRSSNKHSSSQNELSLNSALKHSNKKSITQSPIVESSSMETLFTRTPHKVTNHPGPISKSSIKKSTKSNKKTKNKKDNQLIRKPPVQRQLNIFELTPDQSHKNKSLGDQHTQRSSKSKESSRKRTSSSVSSSRSYVSADGDEDDKKQARREKNKIAARAYRERTKEKELELEEKIRRLQENYDKKRKELRDILIQKHSVIKLLIGQNNIKLPAWMDSDLELLV